MRKIEQLGRRTFLMGVGKGTFALLSEVAFGFGRRGLAVALGGSGLATAACQPQLLQPQATAPAVSEPEEVAAQYFRVITKFVSSYVLIRGNEAAIVDTGLPNNVDKFADVIQSAGLGWDAVNHLILTHHHGDHVGGLSEIVAEAEQATIYAGVEDIAEIAAPQPIQGVMDGDEIFGLQIIGTPGHTPGHISVFDPSGSLLVAGDAMVNVENQLGIPNARFTWDMALANESVKKLAQLNFETMVFGHGDPIESGASAAVAELVSTLE